MVNDKYQDSITVSARAITKNPRIDMRIATRLSSTSRASRVSCTIPTVCRLRMIGSATVTSRRLSDVRRM